MSACDCAGVAPPRPTIDPAGARTYFGGPSLANAARTVFRDTPNVLATTLIGIFSPRCSRRSSAQSSTLNTHFLPDSS